MVVSEKDAEFAATNIPRLFEVRKHSDKFIPPIKGLGPTR
jgi:hypothetical protein